MALYYPFNGLFGQKGYIKAAGANILEIEKKLGRLKGMAIDYGNLALIYRTRGDLAKAEEMHLKALEINKELGRKEGMANQYGNLGNLYKTRGELDRAEEMYQKALRLYNDLKSPKVKIITELLTDLQESTSG